MQVWGIVVAAGSGRRFGGSKHDVLLGGRPLWMWSAAALVDAGVTEVVVVGDVPGGVPGGARRRDSVAAGLAALPEGDGVVVVHDAARPLAGPDLVGKVVDAVLGGADGAIPGLAVRDTLKRVDGGVVAGTVDREGLVAVQTPQAFRRRVLEAAHAAHTGDATDDAQLLERIGATVVVVDGDPRNLKVTYPADLAVAEGLRVSAT